jgi:hypothetical protein
MKKVKQSVKQTSKNHPERGGAGDGIRTRGDLLGGQAFYH